MKRRYSVFGLIVETHHAFRNPMAPASPESPVDLTFTLRTAACGASRPLSGLAFASEHTNRFGESSVQVFHDGPQWVMRFPRIADFLIRQGEIVCDLAAPELSYMVEVCLLGHVLAFYLELTEVVAIHAAAVASGDRAVLFAADQSGGKTTIVASLVAAGHPLVSDDISGLSVAPAPPEGSGEDDGPSAVICRRGFPQVKLSPDQARFFVGRSDGFERFHPGFEKLGVPVRDFGAFAADDLPVSCLYVLNRGPVGPAPVTIEPLAPGEALVHLVRHSFLFKIVEQTSLRVPRLERLGRIVRGVRVARLSYPSGLDRLADVRTAVLAHLAEQDAV